MIIIDGFYGKSKKLKEILKERATSAFDTLILDTVGIEGLINYGNCYRVQNILDVMRFLLDYSQIDEPFGIKIDRKNLKYIVLEVNCNRDMIETFKNAEDVIGKELIITIQCPANESQNEIKVYKV